MKLESLQDYFKEEMLHACDIEEQLLEALPKMAQSARSSELQKAIKEHVEQTRKQLQRLEQVAQEIGVRVDRKRTQSMHWLIREGEELTQKAEPELRDPVIISGDRKIEHVEIAMYESLITGAKKLGKDQAVKLLEQSLAEEKKMDERLAKLAEKEAVSAT